MEWVLYGYAIFLLTFMLGSAIYIVFYENRRKQNQARIQYNVFYLDTQIYMEDIDMLILTDTQQVILSIEPKTKAGNLANVDGIPQWSVVDGTLLEITPDATGLSATITTTGALGTTQVSVTVDADLGEGVTEITGVLDIEVKAGQAVSLGITAGTPTEIV